MPVQLPFLVVHGETIYVVAILAVALLSIWSLWRRRLHLASSRTQSFLTELGPITALANFAAGNSVVVKGSIEFPKDKELVGVLVPSYVDDESSEIIELGTGALLKGESTWQCEGPAEVLWATKLSQEHEKLKVQVHSGEEVHLQGILQAVPASSKDSVNYRESAVEWRLIGTPQNPLRIVSTRAPRPRLGPWGVLLSAAFGVAGFALGAQIIGAIAMTSKYEDSVRVVDGVLHYPLGPVVGATMPFHRADALRHISYELDEASLGELGPLAGVKLDLLRGECPSAALRALQANLWDEAKRVILRCPDSAESRSVSHQVHWVRGEFMEASRLASELTILSFRMPQESLLDESINDEHGIDWRVAANTHILAGSYSSAAQVLEGEAKMWGNSSPALEPDAYPAQLDIDRIESDLHCLAIRARQLAGEEVKMPPKSSLICQLLQTEDLESEQRIARLSEFFPGDEYRWPVGRYVDLLGREAGLVDKESMYFRSEPSIVAVSDIISGDGSPSVPLHLGLLASALRTASGDSDASLKRASLEIELAFWKAMFGQQEQARHMFQEAIEHLLLGASEEVRLFSQELAGSAEPLKAEHVRSLKEVQEIPQTFQAVSMLTIAQVGLAALASRAGDFKLAHRELEVAMAYTGADHHEDYFGRDGFVKVESILGKTPRKRPFSVACRYTQENECPPTVLRVGSYTREHAGYLKQAIGSILQRKAYVDTIDAPQWQAELQAATDLWTPVLFDRDRSLLLGLVNSL